MKEDDDPAIKEIRDVRHRISESVGHDPHKLIEHYIEMQKTFVRRLSERKEQKDLRSSKPVKI